MKKPRRKPIGCELYTDQEVDLIHCIKYSYYMGLGRLTDDDYGDASDVDFKNLEYITNEMIAVVVDSAQYRINKLMNQ